MADPTNITFPSGIVLVNCVGGGFVGLGIVQCDIPNDANVSVEKIISDSAPSGSGPVKMSKVLSATLQATATGPTFVVGGAGGWCNYVSASKEIQFRKATDGLNAQTPAATADVEFSMLFLQ